MPQNKIERNKKLGANYTDFPPNKQTITQTFAYFSFQFAI
ncbi:hypothetical protein X781_7810 [Mannheimia sp. USDA-ARS-USMARC-1261]|nr:hypothetical protein X781_7810 [Mannheimia sp. USDA-ARS-USMARC-1261]